MPRAPELSVVLISYNMARELPRTLRSLSPGYQRNIERGDYEVIVVDNGSGSPPSEEQFAHLDLDLSIHRFPEPTKSPVRALNWGLQRARAPLVGAMIDGARMVTPGFLYAACSAGRIDPKAVVTFLSFHLGPTLQWASMQAGYDQAWEDRLLAAISWPDEGYRLFDIGPQTENAPSGWFGALSESNALFMHRDLWNDLGGFEPAFTSSGGGAANGDMLIRALESPGSRQVVVLGEGTFHQFHGGTATNSGARLLNYSTNISKEFSRIRGEAPRSRDTDRIYFGPISREASEAFLRIMANGGAEAAPGSGFAMNLSAPRYSTGRLAYNSPVASAKRAVETVSQLKSVLLAGPVPLEGEPPADATDATERGDATAGSRYFDRLRTSLARRHYPLTNTKVGRRPPPGAGFATSLPTELDHLEWSLNTVLSEGVEGDILLHAEGSTRAALLVQAILVARAAYPSRTIWMSSGQSDKESESQLRTTRDFGEFGLEVENLRFLSDNAAEKADLHLETLALVRLGGSPDASMLAVLERWDANVSTGGFVIIPEYGLHSSARLINSFKKDRNDSEPVQMIDFAGAFWRKTARPEGHGRCFDSGRQ